MNNEERLQEAFEKHIKGKTMRDLEIGSAILRSFVNRICQSKPEVAELLRQYTITAAAENDVSAAEAIDAVHLALGFTEYRDLYREVNGVPLVANSNGDYAPYLN